MPDTRARQNHKAVLLAAALAVAVVAVLLLALTAWPLNPATLVCENHNGLVCP